MAGALQGAVENPAHSLGATSRFLEKKTMYERVKCVFL